MEQIIKNSKYVDPMIDVAFKQIFGKQKNKRLIKELLEHVFHHPACSGRGRRPAESPPQRAGKRRTAALILIT